MRRRSGDHSSPSGPGGAPSDTSVRQRLFPDIFGHKVTDKSFRAPMGCARAGRRAPEVRVRRSAFPPQCSEGRVRRAAATGVPMPAQGLRSRRCRAAPPAGRGAKRPMPRYDTPSACAVRASWTTVEVPSSEPPSDYVPPMMNLEILPRLGPDHHSDTFREAVAEAGDAVSRIVESPVE